MIFQSLVMILPRFFEKCDWKFFEFFSSRPTFGDVASGASHDIGARNPIEIFWSQPAFGDVASAASHDIGARNAIEIWPTFPLNFFMKFSQKMRLYFV